MKPIFGNNTKKYLFLIVILYVIFKLTLSEKNLPLNNFVILLGIVMGFALICYLDNKESFEDTKVTTNEPTPALLPNDKTNLINLSTAAFAAGNTAQEAGILAESQGYDINATPVEKALAIVRMATQAANATKAAQTAQTVARDAIKQLFLARERANNQQNAMNAEILATAQAEALLQAQAVAQLTGREAQDAATAAFEAARDASLIIAPNK